MTRLSTFVQSNRKEGKRFVKFLVVGAVGFVVDAGTLFALTSLLHIPDLLAQAGSFTAAVISNFIWNRLWTYPESRSKPIASQLTQFFVVNLAGLGIRSLVFAGVLGPYRQLAAAQTLVHLDPALIARYAALATAVTVVLLWNFFVNRYWTYNDVE
jgi:putative flippase GtrA